MKGIWLESAKVSAKSPQNLQIFAAQNVRNTDRRPSDLRYKITPFRHPDKGLVGRRSSASKIRVRTKINHSSKT